MPADNGLDPVDRWLNQQVRPLPPPDGTFELIAQRARRRRLRRTVISVASGAVVAAAVAVAVPVGMSLHLTTTTGGTLASGNSPAPSGGASTLGRATGQIAPRSSATSTTPAPASTPSTQASPGAGSGYLPPDFQPVSVTWDSPTTGWVIGPAGTPGDCANANPDICTSVARTDDGGQTWHGLPAPDTGSPDGATGVSGIRFLDGVNGWAFGPQLWSTHDGGETWTQVNTGGQLVTDLETVGSRAYALFATCADPQTAWPLIDHGCTSFSLKSTPAGQDDWTDVSGVPAQLTVPVVDGGEGLIEFTAATGYLVAPDGTLYSGPVNGGAWHLVSTLPCPPGTTYLNSSLPHPVLLTPAGVTASGETRLGLVCDASPGPPGAETNVWTSDDGGASWTQQSPAGAQVGEPYSVTATPDGTLILATSTGIYLLAPGSTQWQAATLTGAGASAAQAAAAGFSYVGMTTSEQGVAVPNDTSLHEIWMTFDGGQTWQARPITSG